MNVHIFVVWAHSLMSVIFCRLRNERRGGGWMRKRVRLGSRSPELLLLASCTSLTCVPPTHPFTVSYGFKLEMLLFCNSSYLIKVRLACAASPSPVC